MRYINGWVEVLVGGWSNRHYILRSIAMVAYLFHRQMVDGSSPSSATTVTNLENRVM